MFGFQTEMDDLGLDDMVSGVNKTAAVAKQDKNAQVQMMQKLRSNHFSVEKVVIRDDPVAKTAEDVFKALKGNSHVLTVNFSKVKITTKALEFLAEALKLNTTLHTLIINGPIPSEGMLDVIKALELSNNTLHTLTLQGGPGKYFDSAIEKALKDRLCQNKGLLKVNIGPLRSQDVRAALDKLPKENTKIVREKVPDDDEWAKLSFDYDEKDPYVYVYDPNYSSKSDLPTEIGSLKGTY